LQGDSLLERLQGWKIQHGDGRSSDPPAVLESHVDTGDTRWSDESIFTDYTLAQLLLYGNRFGGRQVPGVLQFDVHHSFDSSVSGDCNAPSETAWVLIVHYLHGEKLE
jgi:hypothetical protein